ncbi:acyl-CoA dehydrogenase family protein [Nesterenkonia xinjiangensis]|uniref:Alkylation response protein AidB-like acyl-CoA dehydrogenase n=1 Tax=Nesterenkonia xinjiangensis TaxID=225327 RepID=A0A7Z0GLY2_9MICC|nr:acyl-CoA dehydrogenase family protein [Nesterenkonia xinjiangensis]NYJ78420.1 alkylation response protein AidB-like acyl-CoA dehydrogenase [Nesterenkonia xinjiangensis]
MSTTTDTITHTGPAAREAALPDQLLQTIAAGTVHRELERELPFEPVRQLDEARFGALRVPREFGGPGGTVEDLVRQVIRLAAADSNVAHLYRGHFGFVDSLRFQPAEIQQAWYPRVLAGGTVGNASTEKGGNALGTLNTVLTQDDDGRWRLDGEKFYSTGTIFSDYTRVSASRAGQEGRRFAVVATDAEGVEIIDDWDGFGQKLTGTGTTRFHGTPVEDVAVLDRVPGSHEAIHEAAFFQLYLLAVQVGIARAAVADAVALVAKRTRTFNTSGSGQLFREDPLIQQIIGTMSAKAFAAEATVLEVARIHDRSLEAGFAVGTHETGFEGELPQAVYAAEIAVEQAQVTVPEIVIGVTQELFQTVGASATLRTKALDRHWRNAQTIATHNPIVFRARSIGDWEINGTLPEGLNAIGEATGARR